MTLDAVVGRLSGVRPFSALPREALQMLAFSCAKRRLAAGERLFCAGDAAGGAFVVLEGEIVMTCDGQERRAGAGAVIGESALLVETTRPAEAEAARESQLLEVPRETFRRVLPEFPDAAAKIHRAVAARSRMLTAQLEAIRRRNFTAA